MKTFGDDSYWYAVKSNDRNKVLEFLGLSGEEIPWEDGVEQFLEAEAIFVSIPIHDYVLMSGKSSANLMFEDYNDFLLNSTFDLYTQKKINFLNKLSAEFGTACFFMNFTSKVYVVAFMRSQNGILTEGLFDGEEGYHKYAETSLTISSEEVIKNAEEWSINPEIEYNDIDYSKLSWIVQEQEIYGLKKIRDLMNRYKKEDEAKLKNKG